MCRLGMDVQEVKWSPGASLYKHSRETLPQASAECKYNRVYDFIDSK